MRSETESSVLLSHQIARPAAKASRASTDQSQSIEGAVVCFTGRMLGEVAFKCRVANLKIVGGVLFLHF